MAKRKILVIDTSVLLYDMTAIHSFPGNDVVLPLPVLEELDRFKDRPGLLGESARYVNRYLDSLRELGRLDKKVKLPDSDQTIRIETITCAKDTIPDGLDPTLADNRILATAINYRSTNKGTKIKLITKDINLRVKCDALGIDSEDYYKDRINIENNDFYKGSTSIEVPDNLLSEFYENGIIDIPDGFNLHENQFVVGKSYSGGSFLGIAKKDTIKKISPHTSIGNMGFEPKNKEQSFAVNLLMDPEIELATLTGIAGSGKTFLTVMCGLSELLNQKYKRIIITRSIQPVGKDLGYLPGDIDEKMAPWLAPIVDNIKYAFNDMSYFDLMRQKGEIEIAPLAYIRGRTFNDCYVIVDEAQNATIHELKTIITRIGKGSKIVLLGDTDQVDTPYIDKRSNGLAIIIQKLMNSDLTGHIELTSGQRSSIASLASTIL